MTGKKAGAHREHESPLSLDDGIVQRLGACPASKRARRSLSSLCSPRSPYSRSVLCECRRDADAPNAHRASLFRWTPIDVRPTTSGRWPFSPVLRIASPSLLIAFAPWGNAVRLPSSLRHAFMPFHPLSRRTFVARPPPTWRCACCQFPTFLSHHRHHHHGLLCSYLFPLFLFPSGNWRVPLPFGIVCLVSSHSRGSLFVPLPFSFAFFCFFAFLLLAAAVCRPPSWRASPTPTRRCNARTCKARSTRLPRFFSAPALSVRFFLSLTLSHAHAL